MPKQPEFDKTNSQPHGLCLVDHEYVCIIISMWIFLWFVICRYMPETARIYDNIFGPTAPSKRTGPYKPQITNDDPSFRQVSIG